MKRRINKWVAVILLVSLIFETALSVFAVDGETTYTIQAECNAGGDISPKGGVSLSVGQSQSYVITPDYGYVIQDVLVDQTSVGALREYKFEQVSENHTIQVVFARRNGDCTQDGVCDEEDVHRLRQALLNEKTAKRYDANGDSEVNAVDLVRTMRAQTLWGNTFEDKDEWTLSGEGNGLVYDGEKRQAILSDGLPAGSGEEDAYQLAAGKALYLTDFTELEGYQADYAIYCDVALDEGEITGEASARIVARSTGSNSGYEYGLSEDADGNTYLKLYKRGTSSGKINNTVWKYEMEIVRGRFYSLMLAVYGNRILCYCDGEQVFDLTDDSEEFYADGYVGVRSPGDASKVTSSTYKNFIVYALAEDDNLVFYKSGLTFDTTSTVAARSTETFGTDYSVSADVVLEACNSSKTSYITLMTRRTDNTYYDYRYCYTEGEFLLRLYQYNQGTATLIKEYGESYLQNIIGYQPLSLGEKVRLRITCQGQQVFLFLDDYLVDSFENTRDTAPQSGVVGIKAYNVVGSATNFEVQTNLALSVLKLNEQNLNDGEIQIYEGGNIAETLCVAQGICVDGTILSTNIQKTNLPEFDNTKLGDTELKISVLGSDVPITVTIDERRNEIQKISDELEDIDLNNIDEESKELMQRFCVLSEYEQNLCSQEALNHYHAAAQSLSLDYSKAEDQVLLDDALGEDLPAWDSGVELLRGRAAYENGQYHINQISYGLSTSCWRAVKDLYGEVHTVSADMMTTSVYSAIGLTLNVGNYGYYYARVLFGVDDSGQATSPTVRLYKRTTSAQALVSAVDLNKQGLYLSRGEWFHMDFTCQDGVLSVWINGVQFITYDDSDAVEQFTAGTAGVYALYGDGFFDNFVVCGVEKETSDSAESVTATAYENDFEDATLGGGVNDFVHPSTDYGWKVLDSGATYHLSAGTLNYLKTFTSLEGYQDDYAICCDVALDEGAITSEASARIVARSAGSDSGYEYGLSEAADGTTYLKLYKRGVTSGKINNTVWKYDKEIVRGRYYSLMLLVSGNRILCYCDGEKIFDVTDGSEVYSTGYVGVRSPGTASKVTSSAYQNFIVYKLAEDDNLSFNQQEREILLSDGLAVGNENRCYGVVARNTTSAILHVYEKNPTVSLKFQHRELTDTKFGFEIRKAGETAYVRISYDHENGTWYLKDSVCDAECSVYEYQTAYTVSENEWHEAEIVANGTTVSFTVDGNVLFDLNGISQTDWGRIAIFAEGCAFSIDDMDCQFPSGCSVQSGIVEYYLDDGDDYAAAFEIEDMGDGQLIGVGYDVIAKSEDEGKTFSILSADQYSVLNAEGAYSSMLNLHDGTYLFVKQTDFTAYQSDGDMTSWSAIGQVVPTNEMQDSQGRKLSILHTNSLTEVQLADGTYRIFLPIGVRVYKNELTNDASSHYTKIYYSDDGGATWQCSENDTRDIELFAGTDWAEAKVIRCSDGTLRMYCSRNEYGCMLYSVSEDDGKTWSGMYPIAQLQCALSSFSVVEDSKNEGAYYMVWVNDSSSILGSSFARSRLSLAYSEDGMNWTFLCDVERTAPYVWSDDVQKTTPIFQIVDPSIEVTDDYVYISYGCSDKTLDSNNGYHNAQQIKVVRLDRAELSEKTWNDYTLSDMSFTDIVTLTKEPTKIFSAGSTFTYAGGEIQLIVLDGTVTTIDTKRFYLLETPDMSTAGEKEVVLYNRNGFSVSYTITVK